MKEYKHKQGDRVYFALGPELPKGYGKICGIQGMIYIVELEEPIKDYPFTHLYIAETQVMEPVM